MHESEMDGLEQSSCGNLVKEPVLAPAAPALRAIATFKNTTGQLGEMIS